MAVCETHLRALLAPGGLAPAFLLRRGRGRVNVVGDAIVRDVGCVRAVVLLIVGDAELCDEPISFSFFVLVWPKHHSSSAL